MQAGPLDNGKMWLFENPPVDYLAETYDFRPDEAWFERARLAALRLPNCSASFVSTDGLIATNHHCARGAIVDVTRPGESLVEDGFDTVGGLISRHRQRAAIAEAMRLVGEANKYITDMEPYKLKDPSQHARRDTILHVAAQAVSDLNIMLSPFLPHSANAVDAVIDQLVPLLDKGDLIIDGGNTYFIHTERRSKELEAKGLLYIGTGVSGGEEGARKGPSIMPGGPASSWELIQPIFEAISAKVNGEPCVTHIGTGGAGSAIG